MNNILLVGLGGFFGAISRFLMGGAVTRLFSYPTFPVATLTVNIVGCFLIGLLDGIIEKHHVFSGEARLFIITGLLGGFTTFSAFGFETVTLLRKGEIGIAAANIFLSVTVGLVFVWLGFKISSSYRAL